MAVKTDSDAESDSDSVSFGDVSAFQRDMLGVIAGTDGGEYGLGIKREMRDLYGSEINHGRLYPNLDDLIEMGLVDKEALDKRTNNYSITHDGELFVKAISNWFGERAPNGEEDDEQ